MLLDLGIAFGGPFPGNCATTNEPSPHPSSLDDKIFEVIHIVSIDNCSHVSTKKNIFFIVERVQLNEPAMPPAFIQPQ